MTKGSNAKKGKQGFQETGKKIPTLPTATPLAKAKKAMGSNHPFVLEKARQATRESQEAYANFVKERVIAEAVLDEAKKEGTSLFASVYKRMGKSAGLSILRAGISEQVAADSWIEYLPLEPVIRDKDGKPIGFIQIKKEVGANLANVMTTQYEPWVSRSLWGQGLEMKALLKESGNEPIEYSEWDNTIEESVVVHSDNMTFITMLRNAGYENYPSHRGWQGCSYAELVGYRIFTKTKQRPSKGKPIARLKHYARLWGFR